MPTYEYACEACDHAFEEFQSIKAPPTTVCPKCKKKKVKRLISGGAGFLFKGSGFYITDYRNESYKSAPKSESAPKTETKTETKTESAPAKTDSKPAAASTTKASKK